MTRYLALLGLHFLINFALLPDSAVVAHPVHHDDYANLAASLHDFRLWTPRPVSTLVIATVAMLGTELAYLALNLLVVACVFLCLKFVELFVRKGKPLPPLGFVAGGALAFGFASMIDWTKYFGLLTNLSSALPGLGALCAVAALHNDPTRARTLIPVTLVLSTLSFFAKEDFVLPILVATACLALLHRSRLWAATTAAVAALFAAALLFNRVVGSVFVSGTRSPSDPYFVDLSPLSLATSLGRMLLASTHARIVVALALTATIVAIVVNRGDRTLAVKLAALVVIALSVLAPNSIFPNHAFAYYGFVAVAMFGATLVAAFYAAAPDLRRGSVEWAGALLVLLAAVGVWTSNEPRMAAARWYAEVGAYNRSITGFLQQHRDALRDRTVAVFGVAGLSPWSHSAGGYLTRALRSQVGWQVFVPAQDTFYAFGRTGTVAVQPETACDRGRSDATLFVAFDVDGRGSFAQTCEEALRRVHLPPMLETWGPKSVSIAEASAGFNMIFTGTNLGPGVDVSVGGASLSMVRAQRGQLMTTTIPPRSDPGRVVRFSVNDRGRSFLDGEVEVAGAR